MKTIIDLKKSKKAILILRAVNHNLRQEMLSYIKDRKEVTVTEIYEKLKLEQCVASQHLSILRLAKVVNTKKQGKYIKYSINNEQIKLINSIISQLID